MDATIWVLLAIVTIVRSRDLIVGSDNGGYKIYEENKQASPAIWRQTENVTIAAKDDELISRIVIIDLREEKDGDAKIVEGGEGLKNVTIELKSPTLLRGYEFHIEVYAVSNNEHASEGQNGFNQKINLTEKSKDEAKPSTSLDVPVNLGKHEISSENPFGLSENGQTNKRQNRDADSKDKQPNLSQSHADVSTEVPKLQSTIIPPTNKDKREEHKDMYSSSSQIPEQINTNQPKIHVQDVSKMPETTARNIPLREFKITEGKHYPQGDNDNHSDGENKETTYSLEERHTNINYPQFNLHDVKAVPAVNAETSTAGDDKTKSLRQNRDVNNPVVDTKEHPKTFSGAFSNQDSTQTTEMNTPNGQTQGGLQENGKVNTFNPRIHGNNHNHDHLHHHNVEESKPLNNDESLGNEFKGRHIPGRFVPSTLGSINRQSSTEINNNGHNENSTLLNATDDPKVYLNQPTTIKAESINEMKGNPDISIYTDMSNPSEAVHKKVKRDTTDSKKNSLLSTGKPMDSSASTTTLKPEINDKSGLDNIEKNSNNTDSLKIPIEINFGNESDKKEHNFKTGPAGSEEKERSTRDIISDIKKDKKENEKPNLENTPSVSDISTTTKPEHNKEGHTENLPTTNAQKKVEQPIEPKSGDASSDNKNTTTDSADAAKQKERVSRDTKSVTKSVKDSIEKVSSTEVALGAEIEKEPKTPSINDNKGQTQPPTIVASNAESLPKSEINTKIETNSPGQDTTNTPNESHPKFPREAKETSVKVSTTPNVSADVKSTLNPISVVTQTEDKIKVTKETEIPKETNKSTEKSVTSSQ